MNVSEFFHSLVGVPPETKPVEPKLVKDIKVARCFDCPFMRGVQNTWTSECSLVEYSTIWDPAILQPYCPLRAKPITVSLKEKNDKIKHNS